MTKNRKSHGGIERCRNFRNLYLNETASRWENTSYSASLRRPCFALASRQQSLAQTAPLASATNLCIRANRVPPRGFVQEPVPERPQRLAVKPSSACAGPSGTGFFPFSTSCGPSFEAIDTTRRGTDGGPRRATEVVLNEQPLPVAWRSHDRRE